MEAVIGLAGLSTQDWAPARSQSGGFGGTRQRVAVRDVCVAVVMVVSQYSSNVLQEFQMFG